MLQDLLIPNEQEIGAVTADGTIGLAVYRPHWEMAAAVGVLPTVQVAFAPMPDDIRDALAQTSPDVVVRWLEGIAPGRVFVVVYERERAC